VALAGELSICTGFELLELIKMAKADRVRVIIQ
jgi:chromosome segregation ATPase